MTIGMFTFLICFACTSISMACFFLIIHHKKIVYRQWVRDKNNQDTGFTIDVLFPVLWLTQTIDYERLLAQYPTDTKLQRRIRLIQKLWWGGIAGIIIFLGIILLAKVTGMV